MAVESAPIEVPIGWEVEEDDYGDYMVGHQHPWGTAPAYVITRGEGGAVAQCSACMEYLQLEGDSAAALTA